jgi:hypothetical protein
MPDDEMEYGKTSHTAGTLVAIIFESCRINYGQTDLKCKRDKMLDFVKSAFREFLEIVLWINLILWTIIGGIIGNAIGSYNAYIPSLGGRISGDGHPIIGGIIGLICGLLINIVAGGFFATILNMDENLEQLKKNVKNDISGSSLNLGDNSPLASLRRQEEKKCNRCGKMVDGGYTACPHCGGSEFD